MAKTIRDEQLKLNVVINGDLAKKELFELEGAQKKLRDTNKTLQAEKAKLVAAGKQETAEYKNVTTAIKANNAEMKTNEARMKELRNEIGITGMTFNQLSRRATELRTSLNNMTPENPARKKLENELQQINTRMREVRAGTQQTGQAMNQMGGYAQAMAGNFQKMGIPLGPLQRALISIVAAKEALTMSQRQFKTATDASTVSTGIFSKALRILRIALISTGIGAIVVALGAMAAAIFSTQRGSDALSKALIPLRTIFQRLFGVIQKIGWALIDAFTNPKQAISDLWEFLKSQIVNRIQGVVDMFGALGRVIGSALRGNFKEAGEAAKDFGNAYLQTMTGVEDVTEKVGRAIKGMADEINEAYREGQRLAEIKIELQELAIQMARSESRLNREFQEQYQILSNVNKTEQERLEAGRAAIRMSEQIMEMKMKELELMIEEAEIKMKQNDTDREAQLEYARLLARRDDLQAEHLEKTRRIDRQVNTLLRAETIEREKELEAQRQLLQDYYDEIEKLHDQAFLNSLSRDERELEAIDRKYLALYEKAEAAGMDIAELQEMHANELIEKQKEIEERTQQELLQIKQRYGIDVSQELMDAEMAILQKHYDNKLLSEEEFQQARKSIEAKYQATSENTTKKSISKIKAWEDADADEKIARVQGLLSTAQGLFKENTTAYKILATANATMDTYKAATLALSSYPPPFNFIAMGTTIAAGLAQVAKINAVQFASGKYDVIGADDGRTYRAGVVKQAATGIYPEPTLVGGLGLVGERAPELVVDGPTLKNIQLNAPEIIAAIQAMRVPQYATGAYPQQPMPPAGGAAGNTNAELLMLVRELIEVNKRPTRAKIVYSDLEDVQDEMDDIKNEFSK